MVSDTELCVLLRRCIEHWDSWLVIRDCDPLVVRQLIAELEAAILSLQADSLSADTSD